MSNLRLSPELQQIVEARHRDPFAVLGRHIEHGQALVRALLPRAEQVTIAEGGHAMYRLEGSDIFEWRGDPATVPDRYRLIWRDD
ncbi:MAG: 1,4-alpha-glucan branching enzyme, partial [Chromatiaceae bacterium]